MNVQISTQYHVRQELPLIYVRAGISVRNLTFHSMVERNLSKESLPLLYSRVFFVYIVASNGLTNS